MKEPSKSRSPQNLTKTHSLVKPNEKIVDGALVSKRAAEFGDGHKEIKTAFLGVAEISFSPLRLTDITNFDIFESVIRLSHGRYMLTLIDPVYALTTTIRTNEIALATMVAFDNPINAKTITIEFIDSQTEERRDPTELVQVACLYPQLVR